MKRFISIILSFVVLVIGLPFTAFAESNESLKDITRYSILVLDVSDTASFIGSSGDTIYTADSAIEYVKKSANSFLADLINAKGNNYVAVVAFAKTASVIVDFTDNISEVTKNVSSLASRDQVRDINAGLCAANELFQGVDSSVVRNTILVTTGMTNEGEYTYGGHYNEDTVGSIWRRMDTQIRLYAYANAAYETATSLKESSTLYVLGLFQTMEDMPDEGKEVAEFFRLTASDLATSENTFYDVDDPDAIEFAFGEIAYEITTLNGYFKYGGQINQDHDSVAEYWYSDSYFNRSATRYNASLATMSLCLELSTWSSYDKKNWYNPSYTSDNSNFWQDKLYNVKSLLLGRPDGEEGYGGIGFSDFKANNFWQAAPKKDSIGVCAARKLIQNSSGDKYTLIALVIRGGGYGAEWASNFTIGETGEHDGFATARDNVLDFLDSYISSLNLNDDEKNIKIWITGYSRAGATANMVTGALDSYYSLPNGATTSMDDVYCYTFEAPQGAVKSSLNGNYSNIFNVLNLNDLVPLVAPDSWDFARYNYQNDKTLPSKYTSRNFENQKLVMLNEMTKLGYPNFDYKISEESTMKNFKVDKSKFLPGGDPLWWFEESKIDTNTVLQEGVNFVFDDAIPSREYYHENLEYCVRQLLGILMDYYGAENGLSNYSNEMISQAFMFKLDELFTFDNITYIVSPMFSPNPFKSYDDRVKEVKIRLGKKIGGIFAEYSQIEGFIDSLVDILGDVIAHVAKDVWNNNTDSINIVCKVVDTLVSSEMQGHFPEICLAWCRSLDPNYNDDIIDSTSNVTRLIRINCPVNINVYNSNSELVASVIDDVADKSIDGIINYVNNKGEKLFFLPGDDTYTLDIIATDEGKINYSISEFNFNYNQNTRLQNYYDIPIVKNDELLAIVPEISEEEFVQNDINGSTTDYQLMYNNAVLEFDENFTGESVKQEYYEVALNTEGNGGYVDGAGRFIKGSFAKVQAYVIPNAEFLGWYIDGECVSTELEYRFAVKHDVTLIAKFSNVECNNVSFETDGNGSINATDGTYAEGTNISIEASPSIGYKFYEWTSTNGGIFENSKSESTEFTMPNKETVVIAHFKPLDSTTTEYTITFDPNGGTIESNTLKTDTNGRIDSLPTPFKERCTFDGWYTEDGQLVNNDIIFTDNTKLIANWIVDKTTGTMGDLDGDGKITSADSLLILRQSVSLEHFTDFQQKLADVDGDGSITSADALEVLRYSVGLPTNKNIGETITK